MTDPTRDEVDIEDRLRAAYSLVAVFPEKQTDGFINLLALRNMVPEAADMVQALRERAEAAEAQAAAAWEAGRDAAKQAAQPWDKDTAEGRASRVAAVRNITALTPPAALSAALTARLDAAWNAAIEAAANCAWEEWNQKDAEVSPDYQADRIRALRRAAPTEGEA